MVFVEGRSFNMGSNDSKDEKPIHQVTISSFKMSKYEITCGQYRAYCKATGNTMPKETNAMTDIQPIDYVNFNDANAYCNWLTKTTGKEYRLPTEAEWEFAAKGGEKSNNYIYSGSNNSAEVAWYNSDNSIFGAVTMSCGRKFPNELGLYDMSGNVYEWCNDWYDVIYYGNSPPTNPIGPSSGRQRVVRGGSVELASDLRVTNREKYNPTRRLYIIGFRVVSSQ